MTNKLKFVYDIENDNLFSEERPLGDLALICAPDPILFTETEEEYRNAMSYISAVWQKLWDSKVKCPYFYQGRLCAGNIGLTDPHSFILYLLQNHTHTVYLCDPQILFTTVMYDIMYCTLLWDIPFKVINVDLSEKVDITVRDASRVELLGYLKEHLLNLGDRNVKTTY